MIEGFLQQRYNRVILIFSQVNCMALLPILEYPHPNLHKVAVPVSEVDDRIRKLCNDMLETMYDAQGVGLAATQIDVHERVVVLDVSERGNEPMILINPEVTWKCDETASYQEGCLSVPGFNESVDRPTHIRVKALNEQGEPYEFEADGLLAVCVQHEIDHLDGKLFIERLSKLKFDRIKAKIKKARKAQETA